MAAGDFDGDGHDELAVGVYFEDIGNPSVVDAGGVNILDFDGGPMQFWDQDDFPPEELGAEDRFGWTLATGDFNGDAIDDLVIGAPYEDLGPVADGGLIHVLYGAPVTGLSASSAQIWLQTIDPSEVSDYFGGSLAVGRFKGGASDDLAIGVPSETIGGFNDTGGVNILLSVAGSVFSDGFESGDIDRWSSALP